jgi:hypothetical protein
MVYYQIKIYFAEVAQPGTARDWKSRGSNPSGVRISSSAYFYNNMHIYFDKTSNRCFKYFILCSIQNIYDLLILFSHFYSDKTRLKADGGTNVYGLKALARTRIITVFI